MKDCDGCRWHEYESDTNYHICKCPEMEEGLNYEPCRFFYAEEDAKNDAKYAGCDRY